jgi:enoyl-CoA hydratase
MSELVTYELDGDIATITMDDGKVNALSPQMLRAIGAALDRAEGDGAVVVLSGRDGILSGGFDLSILRAGGDDALGMLRSGFDLAERMLSFPAPVVVACTGHAIAMGVFLLLSGDHRVGADGPFKITANEVAIGLTMPLAAIEICRQRLTPSDLNRAVLLSEVYAPAQAMVAGFLDELAPVEEIRRAAQDRARQLAKLDRGAHRGTKLRVRAAMLTALHEAIEADDRALRGTA